MGYSGAKTFYHRWARASSRELLYRAKRYLVTGLLKLTPVRPVPPLQQLDPAKIRELEPPAFTINPESSLVTQILNGKTFSLNGDGSNEGPDHDIRILWEPERLQHLTYLLASASEWHAAASPSAIRQSAVSQAIDWIESNPFPHGPSYASAMECGLRIPVFFYCLKAADDSDLSSPAAQMLLKTIYLHAWWIEKHLSLFSSLGNHTICECVGLVFAGAIFGDTKAGARWFSRAIQILRQELYHQILDDGGPAEQSMGYHRFVLDLYWLTVDFLEKNGLADCGDFMARLRLGESFIEAFEGPDGSLPAIGDRDDGCAAAPRVHPRRERVEECGEKTHRLFSHSGYTVINSSSGLRFTFDHGPLGMAPLYNHGHADALSVTLSVNGRDFLVDPGTYRYNGAPLWRSYFKSTRAHNTVTIDGEDQAVQETGFIWSKPYRSDLLATGETERGLYLEAVHTGYLRLSPPVRHKRSILFSRRSTFIIQDTFEGHGAHVFDLNYHFHPDVTLTRFDRWWVARNAESLVLIGFAEDRDLKLLRGLKVPPMGWYSPNYGVKVESSVLSCRRKSEAQAVEFLTVIIPVLFPF